MRRRALIYFWIFIVLITSWCGQCWAGNNVGGSASLSWSEDRTVTNLETAPDTSRVPLFLRLDNAPDVRKLAVELDWTPNDFLGPCFYVVPDSSLKASCGWTSSEPPRDDFAGDSTYTWTISFPLGADKTCVTIWVEGGHCEGVPASFCLRSVRALDSNGVVDTIAVLANATIRGGAEGGCPVDLSGVSPTRVASGSTVTFSLIGTDFQPGMQFSLIPISGSQSAAARLAGAASSFPILADSVIIASATRAEAIVHLDPDDSGTFHALLSGSSASDTLSETIVVQPGVLVTPIPAPSWDGCGGQFSVCPGLSIVTDNGCGNTSNWSIVLPPSRFYHSDCGNPCFIYAWHLEIGVYYDNNGHLAINQLIHCEFDPGSTSGGHCHTNDGTRPMLYDFTNGTPIISFDQTTNDQGNVVLDFVTPEIAGDIDMRVWSVNDNKVNPSHDVSHRFFISSSGQFEDIRLLAATDTLVKLYGATTGDPKQHPERWFVDQRITPWIRTMYDYLEQLRNEAIADLISEEQEPGPVPEGGEFDGVPPANLNLPLAGMQLRLLAGAPIELCGLPFGGAVDANDDWVPSPCGHDQDLSIDLRLGTVGARMAESWANEVEAKFFGPLPPMPPRWHQSYNDGARSLHLSWGN